MVITTNQSDINVNIYKYIRFVPMGIVGGLVGEISSDSSSDVKPVWLFILQLHTAIRCTQYDMAI